MSLPIRAAAPELPDGVTVLGNAGRALCRGSLIEPANGSRDGEGRGGGASLPRDARRSAADGPFGRGGLSGVVQ